MILIISENNDYSTSEVIQWIIYYKVEFIRLNIENKFYIKNIYIDSNSIKIVLIDEFGRILDFDTITSIWYRRGFINLNYLKNKDFFPLTELLEFDKQIFNHLNFELKILFDFIIMKINSIPHIGSYGKRGLNKLEVLYEASKLKINIPTTQITTCLNDLQIKDKIITKSISETFIPFVNNNHYIIYTEEINKHKIQYDFFPSKFQSKIDKEADIRIFYIMGKFYSMAIMSQKNNISKIDFRKYSILNPNRCFRISISKSLISKLQKLMDKLSLQSSSIDMLLTKKGKFIFLEVNPIGQFSMTSKPCNYYLEMKIANHLINLINL